MMTKPPERIYLQCYDDQGEYLDSATGEVTWCVDQINVTDAAYVLIGGDDFQELLDKIQMLEQSLGDCLAG